jgi:GMP synthase-like glutamine amidotransferase
MHLAILMTNTDDSAFSKAHPDDGQKFTALLHRVWPDWKLEVFAVKEGAFPPSLAFDGLLITGSPASVHDDLSWIAPLEELVRDAQARQIPMFGACFGHQVIARALGAQVGYNPDGWVLGRIETHFDGMTLPVPLYAAHKEQVLSLPPGARIVAHNSRCTIGGFAIGTHLLTTQYHPEMTGDFVAALLDAFGDDIGADVIQAARLTLDKGTDMDALAEWIAAFYEKAAERTACDQRARPASQPRTQAASNPLPDR